VHKSSKVYQPNPVKVEVCLGVKFNKNFQDLGEMKLCIMASCPNLNEQKAQADLELYINPIRQL
jgi:hypothetical protein